MARVFVDTNVLFPFSVMDLMLALTEDGIHEVLWTETLLAEWERVIVDHGRRSARSASSVTAAIREFFVDSQVAEADYDQLVSTMPGKDPDDRHHMAAAVAGRASTIITWNRVDFPAPELARLGIRVVDPDEYLCELIVELPGEVVATVVRLAAEKRRPLLTPYDLVDRFHKAGVSHFAARLRDLLDTECAGAPADLPDDNEQSDLFAHRHPVIPASEVEAYLAVHRPPEYTSIGLTVPPHNSIGAASHLTVVISALREILTVWQDGATLVIDYDGAYIQALAYRPRILTEIGPIEAVRMPEAVRFGWMDPAGVPERHGDFESQQLWINNPVHEWDYPIDRLPKIAAFLAGSVRVVLGRDPGQGYKIQIFNNLLDDEPHPDADGEQEADGPVMT